MTHFIPAFDAKALQVPLVISLVRLPAKTLEDPVNTMHDSYRLRYKGHRPRDISSDIWPIKMTGLNNEESW